MVELLVIGALAHREEEIGVPVGDRFALAEPGEQLAGELADRLEHPETLAAPPQQALLDERLERVELSARNLLGPLEECSRR